MKKKLFSVGALLAYSVATSAVAAPRSSQTQEAQQTSVSGTVSTKGEKFFLDDQASAKTYEIRGKNLKKWTGKQVKASGQLLQTEPGVIVISNIHRVAAGAAIAGGTAVAAGVKGGVSALAIAGVGAGATAAIVGSLVAADVIGDDDSPASSQ